MASSAAAPTAPDWTDSKRWMWVLGLIVPIIPLAVYALHPLTGWDALWWAGPIVVIGLIPFIDMAFGRDDQNPPDEAIAWLEQDRFYRWCTYAFLPLQFLGLGIAAYLWSTDQLSVLDKVGLAITIGYLNGIGINTAHELGHKKENVERWLSKIALAPTFYGHFFIEHNRGHHVRVATPEDPASSRLGESVWMFFPRTVFGSLVSGWRLEKTRMSRLGKPTISLSNDVINAWLMSLALFGALMAAFGLKIAPYLAIQAIFGFLLLETVNYLEHYGLLRQRGEDGRYERVRPDHSWNSDNITTNVLLYHLQRHSDHHANPTRRYQALRTVDGAPELPAGYATMIVLAWVPPLWRKVMDHRVLAHYGGDITKVNIDPRKRDKILKRYATSATKVVA